MEYVLTYFQSFLLAAVLHLYRIYKTCMEHINISIIAATTTQASYTTQFVYHCKLSDLDHFNVDNEAIPPLFLATPMVDHV